MRDNIGDVQLFDEQFIKCLSLITKYCINTSPEYRFFMEILANKYPNSRDYFLSFVG